MSNKSKGVYIESGSEDSEDIVTEESEEAVMNREKEVKAARLRQEKLERELEELREKARQKLIIDQQKSPQWFNIGEEERSTRLAVYTQRDSVHNRLMRSLKTMKWAQDPYDESTWRNREQLALLNNPMRPEFMDAENETVGKELFNAVYRVVGSSEMSKTYSSPETFRVTTRDEDDLRHILYGSAKLMMKVTPLVEASGKLIPATDMAMIFNEIRVAYFLAELIHGYKYVLSPNFMVLIDWFQASREKLGLLDDKFVAKPSRELINDVSTDKFYNQVTLTEYADSEVYDFLVQNSSLETLRAVIFQVFHAMETAWVTHEMVHYDLHTGNVRMKMTDQDRSPLNGRNLLYTRNGIRDRWYRLHHLHLYDHIVKIIDFGFSRIKAPTRPNHTPQNGVHAGRHTHNKDTGIVWMYADIEPTKPNRFTDVRLFLLSLLRLPSYVWHKAMSESERTEFFDFVEDMLDFPLMTRLIEEGSSEKAKRELAQTAGGALRAYNISNCISCLIYLSMIGSYARSATYPQKGKTVTDALNHSFFDSLIQQTGSNGESFSPIRYLDDVVVSFFTQNNQEKMLTTFAASSSSSSSSKNNNHSKNTTLKCRVCEKDGAEHFNVEEDGSIVPLCGDLCAEFRYHYNEKTACW